MEKIMRIIVTSIFLIIISATSFAQQQLTLKDAIRIALHKNSTLQKNQNSLETFESGVLSSWGNFLPTLNAGADWRWSRSDVDGIFTQTISGVPISSVSTESRDYSAGFSSGWTLFDGLANFATLSQSENYLESAKLSLDRLKQDIIFQTMSLYYDVINTTKLLEVKQDNLKWNQKNLETIRERNKLGAATLADVYQQEVATGNAELEIITTNNRMETAEINLFYYLGLDVLEDYEFSYLLTEEEQIILNTDFTKDFENITELVNQALRQRKDYKSAELNLESSLNGITIAQSGHWPSLSAMGSVSWLGSKLSELENSRRFSVGLSLNIPIFLGWSVSNRVQFAEVDAKNSEIELSDLERNIKRELRSTFLDLQAALKGLNVSENNVVAAGENLKIEEEKYSLGSGKLLDVLIANSQYTTALTDLINAQFAYIVLSEQLKYNLGVLDFKMYE
jgi:outer membrane protein